MWKYLKAVGNSRTYERHSCFIYIFNCLMFLWLRLQWSFICCSQQYLLSMKARTLLMGPTKSSRTINKTIVKRIWRLTAACGRCGTARLPVPWVDRAAAVAGSMEHRDKQNNNANDNYVQWHEYISDTNNYVLRKILNF